jgi:hypothetical protein
MAVLIVSQWPVGDLPPPQTFPQGQNANQFDTQDRIQTTVENIQQISQNVQTMQKEIDKEFESLSSALQSLHGDIRNKKIPSNYSDAQQWLNKRKKEVAALILNKGEIEKSQQFIVEKSKKVVASSIQQVDKLLHQQDLSQDQRKQINEATNNLKNYQQALESIFTNHLQSTQNGLSKLEDVLQQSAQTVLARKNPPKKKTIPPQSVSKAEIQLAALKAETHSLDIEIKDMVKSFEESTRNFISELSNVRTEIEQLRIDMPSDPKSTQKLEGLKENIRTIQQKAQKVFTQQKSRKQNLIKTFETTAQTYQGFPKNSLDSSQEAELGRLNAILKNIENQLNAFPPDSWNRLQSLSLEIESAIMATKNMMAQNTEEQREKARRLAEEEKQKSQKAAEEARQKEADQRAEQQRLAAEEAQRRQALAREERERLAQTAQKDQMAQTMEALNNILDDFTTAYQNRDLFHLKLTTLMSESRTRNLDLMFKNYRTIKAHTKVISTSETQAKAKVFIDKLINQEGENITPNFIIRETTITIPKKDGKWGKIQW